MNTPSGIRPLLFILVCFSTVLRLGAAGVAGGELPPAVAGALVKVEVLVQAADGEEPKAAGWNKRCPKCGNFHDNALDDALRDERPALSAGFLVAPDRVLTTDPLIQSRFVQRWQVRVGDEVIGASPVAWALDRSALLLALERPAVAAKPLVFSPQAKEPFYTIHHGDEGNGWSTWIQPFQGGGWLLQDGQRHRAVTAGSLFVDASGAPVAVSMSERLPAGESWRESYAAWPWVQQGAYEAMMAKVRTTAAAGFLRAELVLRPVPVRPGEDQNRWNRDEDEKKLAQAQTAVVIAPRRVLVLSALTPSQTARLDKVRLTLADGSLIDAAFVGSSDEYGALVVDPGRDLVSPVVVIGTPWESLRDRLLLTADIRMAGDERTIQCGHLRLTAVQPGFKGRSVPSFAQGIESTFVFDTEGRLVGLPMARRVKAKQNRWESAAVSIVAAAETVRFNDDAAGWADARNRPLTEAESRQLSWLGVDLQPLDAELALTHGVSAQTEDGDHGALVTYVYAGSPAAKVGLKAGDVVLRVQPEGAAKPVEVKVEQHAFSDQPFPWDRYDQINETYYDRIPPPWMPAEDSLNRQLKDFGTGTPYRLDYARGGRVASLDLKVEAGPVHYMTAPEGSRDGLGFRVRELTFETRRYYQLADDAAALIVAKVEAGGAASTAGLKPYELIMTINEQSVGSVAEFDRLLGAGGVLRIGVKRMSQSRVVILDAGAKVETSAGGK